MSVQFDVQVFGPCCETYKPPREQAGVSGKLWNRSGLTGSRQKAMLFPPHQLHTQQVIELSAGNSLLPSNPSLRPSDPQFIHPSLLSFPF